MKKNIMLLFGLFLGVSNINCLSLNLNTQTIDCLLKEIEINDVIDSCEETVGQILRNYPSYDIEALVKSIAADTNCLRFFSKTLKQFKDICGKKLFS